MAFSDLAMMLLLVFASQALAGKGTSATADKSVDNLLDNVVDKLLDRAVKALSLHHTVLNDATVGKPGHSAVLPRTSGSASSLTSRLPQIRSEALPSHHMQRMSLDGRAWAKSLGLRPCAELYKSHAKRLEPAKVATRDSLAEKTSSQTQIEEIIALQPLVIFSKSTCPFCAKAKESFKNIGVATVPTVELDTLQPKVAEEIQDHLGSLTGARTVPRVFVGHKFIGGGDDVVKLAESGELKTLVDKAREEYSDDLRGKNIGKIQESDEEWSKKLDPKVYNILRGRGTERPGSHEYDQFYPEAGYFSCAGCGLPLYSASSKFKSNCGWPVFDMCYHSEDLGCHVCTRPDGTGSLEILCPKCSGHLGHVFFDSFTADNPNGERH